MRCDDQRDIPLVPGVAVIALTVPPNVSNKSLACRHVLDIFEVDEFMAAVLPGQGALDFREFEGKRGADVNEVSSDHRT